MELQDQCIAAMRGMGAHDAREKFRDLQRVAERNPNPYNVFLKNHAARIGQVIPRKQILKNVLDHFSSGWPAVPLLMRVLESGDLPGDRGSGMVRMIGAMLLRGEDRDDLLSAVEVLLVNDWHDSPLFMREYIAEFLVKLSEVSHQGDIVDVCRTVLDRYGRVE